MSITQHLKIWNDTTEAEAYLQSFEMLMEEADIGEENRLPIIQKQLVGKALSEFMELNAMEKTHYLEFKESLLKWLGSTSFKPEEQFGYRNLDQMRILAQDK